MTTDKYKSIDNLAVDYKTSLVYWTYHNEDDIFRCDLDGNGLQRLNLPPKRLSGKIAVFNNVMYCKKRHFGSMSLHRAHIDGTAEEIIQRKVESVDYLQTVPSSSRLENSTRRPCSNNSCSQICVQSSQNGYVCLCTQDYVLHSDGHSCKGRNT